MTHQSKIGGGIKPRKLKVSLVGQLEEITMMELRGNPGQILTETELGKKFVITRNGQPTAVLSSLPGDLIKVIGSNGEISYKNPERSWA